GTACRAPARARAAPGRAPAGRPARGRARATAARARSRLLLHRLAELCERAGEPGLYRSLADPERGGRLLLGELEEVAAGDRVAVLLGEPLDRGEQLLVRLAREESRLGGRDRVPRAVLSSRTERQGVAPAGGAAA